MIELLAMGGISCLLLIQHRSCTHTTIFKFSQSKLLAGEAQDDNPGCYQQREDYFECLHSRKETARVQLVLDEQKKQLAEAK